MTIYGYTGTSGQVSNGDSGSDIGAAGVIQSGTNSFNPTNASGGSIAAQTIMFHYTASAEL